MGLIDSKERTIPPINGGEGVPTCLHLVVGYEVGVGGDGLSTKKSGRIKSQEEELFAKGFQIIETDCKKLCKLN